MSDTVEAPNSGYKYIPGVTQYSCGIAAMPGYALKRVRFSKPVDLKEGFDRIEQIIKADGRPLTSFGACELRSPAPFTEQGFIDFNEIYIKTLQKWGVMVDGVNPVSRSNICPEFNPPAGPSFHAFTYAVEAKDAPSSFVIAGSAEAPEGKGPYRDNTIRLGDTSADALREKALWVFGEMERRMSFFGGNWDHLTAVQLYTVHDAYAMFRDEFGPRGLFNSGVTWHFNRPPVKDLEFEMDCRRVHIEQVVDV